MSQLNSYIFSSTNYIDELAHASAWLSYAKKLYGDNAAAASYQKEAESWQSQVPGVPWAVDWNDKKALVSVSITDEAVARWISMALSSVLGVFDLNSSLGNTLCFALISFRFRFNY